MLEYDEWSILLEAGKAEDDGMSYRCRIARPGQTTMIESASRDLSGLIAFALQAVADHKHSRPVR